MTNSSDWLRDDRVQELLAEWTERREAGEDVSVSVLCLNDPQLAGRLATAIEELRQTDWILEANDASQRDPNVGEQDETRWRELSKVVSAAQLLEQVESLRLISKPVLDQVRSQLSDADGPAAAQCLFAHGLTAFQLTHLCEDRGEALLLNDYLLLEPIGAGGMGRVYKALQRTMNRIVAVKVMKRRAFGSEQAIERFRREVRTAARLTHANIVAAYDAGEADGRHYLVMEFVEGCDLATLVRHKGPVNHVQAVDYTCRAAEALEYAHQQGIIHRDVKPSNLLLDSNGKVKVLDLGLARGERRDAQASPDLTASGQVMGTVDYLAPEQAVDSRQADERSDVYSLGCTLYSLLHGNAMYAGESVVNRILAHQSAEIPSLSKGRDDIPDILNRVFLRMVAKRPEDRFQTMDEVLNALRSVHDNMATMRLAGSPNDTTSQAESSTRRALRWCAVTVGIILLGAMAIYFLTPGSQLPQQAGTISTAGNARPQKSAPDTAVAPFSAEEAAQLQQVWAEHLSVPVEYENSIGMKFRLIPPGEFVMGSTKENIVALQTGEASAYVKQSISSEFPQHTVRISSPFYLAAHETTQAQYLEITGTNPSYFPQGDQPNIDDGQADQLPVDRVSWFDCLTFCNLLSQRDGLESAYELVKTDVREKSEDGYRLPTEARWEYAASGGSDGDYCSEESPEQFGWFDVNSDERTHPVGLLQPNAFGLYDVHGNVGEWCSDWFHSDYYRSSPILDPPGPAAGQQGWRMLRGGTFKHDASRGRLRTRSYFAPEIGRSWKGCRVMLSVDAVRQMISRQAPPPAVAPFSD